MAGIHIKPENKGKFNALKKRTGKTTEELTHSKNPLTRKRAVFAQNAKKWKHEDGGVVYATGGINPYAQGAGMLGGAITQLGGDNTETAMLGGALSGAASGAMLGPLGMAGGAILGGVTSLIGSNAKAKQQDALKQQQWIQQRDMENQQYRQSLTPQQQYSPTFANGGKVLYKGGGEVTANGYKPDDQKYTDSSVINPYTDPFTQKKFYVVKGTTANIGRKDVFPIDTDSNGRSIMYGTYTQPRTKDAPNEFDYLPTTYRKYADGVTKPFYPSNNLMKLDQGNNPYVGRQQLANPSLLNNPDINPMYKQPTNLISTQYARGGMINTNSELEQGEPFRTPNGQIGQVSTDAPTHAEGGVQMDLPQGTEILGKMTDPATQEEFKVLGQKLKSAQDRYTKVLENKPTPLAKKTAKMMLDKVQGKYDQLMQRQEAMKQSQDQQQMYANGGMVQKYANGTPLYGTSEQSYSNPYPLYTDNTQTYNIDPRGQQASANTSTIPQQQSTNWGSTIGNALETAGTFAPIAYNLYQGLKGKANTLNASNYYNPYSSQVKSLMANRRYDVSPELEANKQASADYYQNLRQGAPSQSRYLAGLQTGQIARQRADQDVYSKKQNVDNQYMAEQAQSLTGLGNQEAATNLNIEDINARRTAAQRQYLPTALSQLQQAAFVGKNTKNQKLRDKQRIALAKDMYGNYPFDVTKIFNEQ
jgi:hypothetical protein